MGGVGLAEMPWRLLSNLHIPGDRDRERGTWIKGETESERTLGPPTGWRKDLEASDCESWPRET